MRILDLGCGAGQDLAVWGVTDSDEVAGVDINEERLAIARGRFPRRIYKRGAGECLPFGDQSFDRVISNVALPYMKIPRALAEIHRGLVPGGKCILSVHPVSLTIRELRDAFPKPIPTLFRMYIIANGMFFHCTGRTVAFLKGRTESFQTERGMRMALERAGFGNLSFTRPIGLAGERLIVEAEKIPVGRGYRGALDSGSAARPEADQDDA